MLQNSSATSKFGNDGTVHTKYHKLGSDGSDWPVTRHKSSVWQPKALPILAVRGLMGTIAMSLYYEAFERLMLGEAVSILLRCSNSALCCLK